MNSDYDFGPTAPDGYCHCRPVKDCGARRSFTVRIFVQGCALELEVHIPMAASTKCYQILQSVGSQHTRCSPGCPRRPCRYLRKRLDAFCATPNCAMRCASVVWRLTRNIFRGTPSRNNAYASCARYLANRSCCAVLRIEGVLPVNSLGANITT